MKPLNELEKPDDLSELGPAMAALPTDRQRRFVWEYTSNGGRPIPAFLDAGYRSSNTKAQGVAIHQLLHQPKIVAALQEMAIAMFSKMTVPAIAAMQEILGDPYHKERTKVAMTILDRSAGFGTKTEHNVKVEHVVDDKEMLVKAKALALEMGVDPVKLLGARALDATFTEVEPDVALEDLF